MRKRKEPKEPVETPPICAVCDERPADGVLYVSFSPYAEQRASLRPRAYGDPTPMNRGWSLHLPICGVCVRASVKVGVQMEIKNEKGTWAHLSSDVPR